MDKKISNLKKSRAPFRTSFTKLINDIDRFVDGEPDEVLLDSRDKLAELGQKLRSLDDQIMEALLESGAADDIYMAEFNSIEEYQDKFRIYKRKLNQVMGHSDNATPTSASASVTGKRTYKLPKLELRKFNGELKDWLGWWSQFEKIHSDDELHDSDKFQYLIQATVESSAARRLVDGYPQTAENYPKAVAALRDRFGDKVLLTELYVRQLASLVILNANKSRSMSLGAMFDQLEASIRSLESLGVTSEESAAFLYPLVESSLPDDTLRMWQRSALAGYTEENERRVGERLKALMKFLKMEVKGEQRLSFVNSGIEGPSTVSRSRNKRQVIPTAAGLLSTESPSCVFCNKAHESRDCGSSGNLSWQDKQKKIKDRKCCFVCLKFGHNAKKCRTFVKCILCSKRHYVIMCPDVGKPKMPGADQSGVSSNPPEVNITTTAMETGQHMMVLPTIRICLSGPEREKSVRALIDSGAQRSYILKSTAEELQLEPAHQLKLSHMVFGGKALGSKMHNSFSVTARAVKGGPIVSLSLLGQERICNVIPPIPESKQLKLLLSKSGIQLSDQNQSGEIEVLLGADSCAKILTNQIQALTKDILAINTKLGWTLMGVFDNITKEDSVAANVITSCLNTSNLEQLWSLDTLGIKDSIEVKTKKVKEDEVMENLMKSITRASDGRYEVSLPWKNDYKMLDTNRLVAESRLNKVTFNLKNKGFYNQYGSVFDEWVAEGFIEVCEDKQRGHFLPHRPVYKESRTTPVRPVFDASCKTKNGPSLNDLLEVGPNLLDEIPKILLRFRKYKYGVSADIRKAFQMIQVTEEDRKYLKFLWWNQDGTYKIFQHKRVVFGVRSSPFILNAVLQYHLMSATGEYEHVAQILRNSFYVDNCLVSLQSQPLVDDFKRLSTKLLAGAQMTLRQWEETAGDETRVGLLSGSECGLESGSSPLGDREQWVTSVLGMRWDKKEDTISCATQTNRWDERFPKITKRALLSAVATIFDPIGFTSPALLVPKLMLQNLWKKRISWDTELDEETQSKFLKWKTDSSLLMDIKVPRHVHMDYSKTESLQLHCFCDASSYAYGCVIFLRVNCDNKCKLFLLSAKSRIAPVKKCTIPRLELLACLIGARLMADVKASLMHGEIQKFYWTDSSTALAWIRRKEGWGTYVGNRVMEINNLTSSVQWNHIVGEFNPADLPSRGCSPRQLVESEWWNGPLWLKHAPQTWPSSLPTYSEKEINNEKKKSSVITCTVVSQNSWYVERYSCYLKNLKLFAWVRRFIRNTRGMNKHSGDLTSEECDEAEEHMFRLVQKESFPFRAETISGLRVTIKDDLIRVRTKLLNKADFEFFTAPVLLPSYHSLVTQLVLYVHHLKGHAGVQITLTSLREKVWIVRGRKTVTSILRQCYVCQRYTAKNATVDPAPLPSDRVNPTRPFEVTGVDLAGPLFLKNGTKSWVVLFTCAMFRCVHLELVQALTTDAFIMSLTKFICRRGRPRVIWSDNGTNFRGTYNLFRKLNWKKIQNETLATRINWKFIPPTSAWWGGWWERIIRCVKDLMKRMLGHKKLTFSQLEVTLCEVEASLNDRPLTYVSEDQDDLSPLTPSLFLNTHFCSQVPELNEVNADGLRMSFKSLAKLREELHSRFRKEYLSMLVHRSRGEKPVPLKVGDVVMVGADQKKRLFWPIGRVVELIPGSDGKVRVAKVKVRDCILVRPLQRLYPFEVQDSEKYKSQVVKTPSSSSSQPKMSRYGRKIIKPDRYQ